MKKILTLLLLSGGVFAQSGVALKGVILTDLKIGQARAIHELVKGTATEYDPNETDLTAFEVLQSKLKSYDKTQKPNIQRFVPTAGATVAIAPSENDTINVILQPAGTLATLTITPPTCLNGKKIIIASTQVITVITVTGSVFALSTLGLNGNAGFIFNSSNSTWYKIQ